MRTVQLEYGNELQTVSLPDTADVFIAGETVPDPPFLPDPATATMQSVNTPAGMPPLGKQVRRGSRVVIVFPDKVKGGMQPSSHRKTAIPVLVNACLEAGAAEQDIHLVCSNGLHRKMKPDEIRALLGDDLFKRFWSSGSITNHDSENDAELVDLGRDDELGSRVLMNRRVFEADVAIQVGHVLGNPYGGYSGGYKHCATGITHWESIASHHTPQVMHRDDFIPVGTGSLMRKKFDAIGRHMEKKMGKSFFTCDAVLDTFSRQIAVFSGAAGEVQKLSWQAADRRTLIPWAEEPYDILVFGMPRSFHYGRTMGTNPILIMQAISAQIIRHKRVLKEGCVVICASVCDGDFGDEEFPSYRATYELFQQGRHQILPDLAPYGESFSRNEEYIEKYRFHYGFHPYHAFSMISCGHIAEKHCAAVYITGAASPAYARGMGMKTRETVEEALEDAMRKYTGSLPRILALPMTFTRAGVHLDLKNGG